MDISSLSLLIVAGGRSSRMGQDKRWLELDGVPMLEWLLRKAARQPFARRYLCCGAASPELEELAGRYGAVLVEDEREGCGPMEGLRCGLRAMPTEYAAAVSCDMPFFVFPVLRPLLSYLPADGETGPLAVLSESGGRLQPLAALYHRSVAVAFEEALAAGERRLRGVIEPLPHHTVPLGRPECFFNVNDLAGLRLARGRMANMRRPVPLLTVSAPASGTGKTTFIERLIPLLREEGLRIGVVKGDCHGYEVDTEGKDSWRFRQAGAESVAVVSPHGYFIERSTPSRASLLSVANQLEGTDLVLLETRSHGCAPKISLWRGGGGLLADEETAAWFTSAPLPDDAVAQYDLDDMETAKRLTLFLMGREGAGLPF